VAQPETDPPSPQGRQKNNWWLGWNGERLANGHDSKMLAEHHPEIWQWVVDNLHAGVEAEHRTSRQ
jgi:hypothetical protein